MNIFRHRQVGEVGKENEKQLASVAHPEKCPYCGRQLMVRTGLFRRLRPVSNAFVLNGYCLCHESHSTSGRGKNKLKSYDNDSRSDPLTAAIMNVPLQH